MRVGSGVVKKLPTGFRKRLRHKSQHQGTAGLPRLSVALGGEPLKRHLHSLVWGAGPASLHR